MSYPLSVIVPTYNRSAALGQCMMHLEGQSRKDFEVVVVDDGSTDSTEAWISEYLKHTPLSLRYFRQNNGGPARARNFAISQISSPVTLLIGDDIFPSAEFIAFHLRLHEQRTAESVVGLGLTVWAEQGQQITPFMRWLDTDGMQFNYGELLRGAKPDWRHFYTSNLSLKTSLLRSYPFDESFPYAAMEDIEAACRIEAEHGLDMIFLPDAIAYHLHPMTFANACRRMEKVGESAAYFDKLWPGKMPRTPGKLASIAGSLLRLMPWSVPTLESMAERSINISCPNRLMNFVLSFHFEQGYRRWVHQGANQPLSI